MNAAFATVVPCRMCTGQLCRDEVFVVYDDDGGDGEEKIVKTSTIYLRPPYGKYHDSQQRPGDWNITFENIYCCLYD